MIQSQDRLQNLFLEGSGVDRMQSLFFFSHRKVNRGAV
ncbi:hypothetical protein NRI_0566 [Neorickettsia risticii str. Illinois]|uniref:Uncharacterized protein n=1 Tax=Neorickettsia risticii (strain Illinois) TaxID=434131 RepID=C6V577_NEORI|nr:hypothetical protein NRI_0566 [Neorickettsia risticii str. Illinois]